jgi:hypothetical protein
MTATRQREPMGFERRLLPVLIEELRSRDERAMPTPPGRSGGFRWRRGLLAGAAAVALAVFAPIVLPSSSGGADPAAADALYRVALRAAQQPPEPLPGPNQYLYTRSESSSLLLYVVGDGTTFFFRQPTIRESWIRPDGAGRIRNTLGRATFPSAADRATWLAAGSPELWDDTVEDELFAAGELTFENYSDLPTDPDELLEELERRELIGGPPGDWETFEIVGGLLRETYTTPEVRAALYRVVAELPGVELRGRVVDGAGRPGVSVVYTYSTDEWGSAFELIFDPRTAALLGTSELIVRDSEIDVESGGPGAIYGGIGPAGARARTSTYLVSGVVDSTNESL